MTLLFVVAWPPAPENPAAEVQANRESQIIVAQDQAPHAEIIGREPGRSSRSRTRSPATFAGASAIRS